MNLILLFFIVFQIYFCIKLYKQKKYKLLTTYILFSVIIYLLILVYFNYCSKPNIYIYSANTSDNNLDNDGPTVLVISGSHGNECGPSAGLDDIKEMFDYNKIKLKRGKLILIPTLNKCGRQLNTRFQPQELLKLNITKADVNRNYGKIPNEEGHCTISKTVQKFIKDADYILDFHEGWGFNKLNPESMGQTFYPGTIHGSKDIANQLKNAVNKVINTNNDYKYYDVVEGWAEIPGSLRQYANINGIKYVLTEIAGQGQNQTLEEKKDQTKAIFFEFLNQTGLI